MAWQIATFTPRCFTGIFTLSGSGSPGLSDLIPTGNVWTRRWVSRCLLSVAASMRSSSGGRPGSSVPLPPVYDLLLSLLDLRDCLEADLATQPGDLPRGLDDPAREGIRWVDALRKDDPHLHPVLVSLPGYHELGGCDFRHLPLELGNLLGVDEHPLDLGDLVHPADQFEEAGGS